MKLLLLSLLFAGLAMSGCTTKSKAAARAREAYLAGERQAIASVSDAQRTSIRFIGPVRNVDVPWSEGLTLARAISAAGYTDIRDPRTIIVNRKNERIPFDPADLLRGKDLELEPGDTIEIHP